MTREPQRREIRVHGLRLSYLEWGTPDEGQPTVVLLHGLIAEGVTFGKLVRELPPELHVIAIDLPGAGFSDRPDARGDVTFAGMAALLRDALTALGLERPVMLGHSHGGVIALRLAVSHREALSGLVLLCPAHPFSAKEQWLVRFYLSPLGTLFAHALPHLPKQLHMFAFKRMPGSRQEFSYDDLDPYLHTLRTPGTVAHLLRLLQSWEEDMAALADAMRTTPLELPTLLLWGESDIVVPISTAEPLLEHMPNAWLVPMPNIGHVPTEEAPQACAENMAAWLRKLRSLEHKTGKSTE